MNRPSPHALEVTPTLASLAVGDEAEIVHVAGDRRVTRRLLEMGLLPGTHVRVLRMAPLGDPIELCLRGYALSIRHADAAGITVKPAAGASRDK
jgi:Fe2+ transport system protein FeoA